MASEVGICSKIGVDVIKKGGNAADAVSLRELPAGGAQGSNQSCIAAS